MAFLFSLVLLVYTLVAYGLSDTDEGYAVFGFGSIVFVYLLILSAVPFVFKLMHVITGSFGCCLFCVLLDLLYVLAAISSEDAIFAIIAFSCLISNVTSLFRRGQ